jgi:hypothetical protein
LTNADKKHNKTTKIAGLGNGTNPNYRGKITPKHLAVQKSNELYGLELKLKDDDIADAILLGRAFLIDRKFILP